MIRQRIIIVVIVLISTYAEKTSIQNNMEKTFENVKGLPISKWRSIIENMFYKKRYLFNDSKIFQFHYDMDGISYSILFCYAQHYVF